MTDFLVLMQQKRAEIGDAALAEALGVSRVTIRSICTENYPGDPAKVLKRFGDRFIDVVHCPHIDQQIARKNCDLRAHSPKPFGGNSKMAWWEACQECSLKRPL